MFLTAYNWYVYGRLKIKTHIKLIRLEVYSLLALKLSIIICKLTDTFQTNHDAIP